ncbi:hypothetical protein MHZ92_04835 [Sporosarcina sp. ACRSL]|uniref:hypothetical protein n=1 Tax=Sporosarcina sp. ACRSL TaxID=2918215 RepID=UPI001EF5DC76|nr:hypothetical protein [Sporosarcina sp. ACRSL]MCG7343445.1 hypothetical protein [Sporosarcina sp. ACRSL]
MNRWSGLFKKEWMLMRMSMIFFTFSFIVIAVSSFAPAAVGGIVESDELTNMFSTMHIFIGAALFLQSLHTDMKEPDLWLHSPASIAQLLGVKVIAAVILIAGSFLIWTGIAIIAYFIGGIVGIVPDLAILVKVLVNTIFMMSVSLLIWVIYKMLAVRVRLLAGVVMLLLIFVGFTVWGVMEFVWKISGSFTGTSLYIIVAIVLFTGGATLLEKKVRY